MIPRYVIKQRPKLPKLLTDPRNLVKVSFEDHKELHRLRFQQYGEKARGDKIAYLKMSEKAEEAWLDIRREGAATTHKVLKNRKATFWDADFQKQMAQRSLETPHARQVRSLGGKKGGKNRQLDRIITPTDKFCFSFQGQEKLCVFNCRTGTEVLSELHKCNPTPLKRASQLLTGKRKSLYGWSCTKISMTISSEADKGQSRKQPKGLD